MFIKTIYHPYDMYSGIEREGEKINLLLKSKEATAYGMIR
jgi:hypothetical protein